VEAQAIHNAEAEAALEITPAGGSPELPVLEKSDLAPDWQAMPVLCVAGRGPLDEAVAMMLAQLLSKHGLAAGTAGADTITTPNIPQLEAKGLAIVCLSYLDTSSLAHMRYAVRRIRRKLPSAKIFVGCWMMDGDNAATRETLKADAVATSLAQALRLCVEAAHNAKAASAPRTNAPVGGTSIEAA
jgi:hypothetical protein